MMINFNNFGKGLIWKTAIVAGVFVFVLAGQVVAEGKRGPRASLLSSTECALDLPGDGEAFLAVTTTLTNKSSGNTVPEVRAGSMIQGTYKDTPGRAFIILETVPIYPVPQDVDPELTLMAEFPLCNGDGTVSDEVFYARELNGLSTINYGISGGDGETRTLMNRCTDDPDTAENEGSIKVADVIDAIEDACSLPSQ